MTDPVSDEIFSNVLKKINFRMSFVLAKVNWLKVAASDAGYAYLNNRTKKNVAIIVRPEFGPELEQKTMPILKHCIDLSKTQLEISWTSFSYIKKPDFRLSKQMQTYGWK